MHISHHFITVVIFRVLEVAAFFLVGVLLESVFRLDKNVTRRGVLFNCAHAFCYEAFSLTGGVLVTSYIDSFVARAPFHGFLSTAIHRSGLVPASIVLGMGIAVVNDFFYYWFHRWQHSSPWLWAQHELHHSEEHMNVTTNLRMHWSEVPLKLLFVSVPMGLLFKPEPLTIGLAVLIWDFPGYFAHLNCPIRFGVIGRVFNNPQTHRIHHSVELRHIDKNFGVFLIWDMIFGTYYEPAKDEWPETGLASGKRAGSFAYSVVMPFLIWARMLKPRECKDHGVLTV